jgi:amino acid transporter
VTATTATEKKSGKAAATLIGVGAIVGGGIFVLGGVAIREAGSFAALAFLLNGIIVSLTIYSTSHISRLFPESGGAYLYAKRILSVRAAFVIGWMLWFAHVVASLLYSLGFAAYFSVLVETVPQLSFLLSSPFFKLGTAFTVVLIYTALSYFRMRGESIYLNCFKVILFLGLIFASLLSASSVNTNSVPNASSLAIPGGLNGLFAAMGFTFIALQGFELIAASSGSIAKPERTVGPAMYYSLAISLCLYIPLILIVVGWGVPPGQFAHDWCGRNTETCIVDAFKAILGTFGYYLVVVIAMVGMLTALHANIIAAARTTYVMALDRALPAKLAYVGRRFKTPELALVLNAGLLFLLLEAVEDVATAGSAASLAFLVCFALMHILCFLALRRKGENLKQMQRVSGLAVAALGATLCIALAAFQLSVDPLGAKLLLGWVVVGGLIYYQFLSKRAEIFDAFSQANTPELYSYRLISQIVLLPIVNPDGVNSKVKMASILAPPRVGRILLLSVASTADGDDVNGRVARASSVIATAVQRTLSTGHSRVEGIVSAAIDPWQGIKEVSQRYDAKTILLGFSGQGAEASKEKIENLLEDSPSNIAIMHTPDDWDFSKVTRVVVPIGGKGQHDRFRAQTLGGLLAAGVEEVLFLRILSENVSRSSLQRVRQALEARVADEAKGLGSVLVEQTSDVVSAIARNTNAGSLTILGLSGTGSQRVSLGPMVTGVVDRSQGATLIIRKGN